MDEAFLIGGIEARAIELVAYDAAWPGRFAFERRRIRDALGNAALRVDHVGSTAVVGLAAKAIIDVQLSVLDPDDERSYLPLLLGAGYELRVREPGHRMLRTPALDVHVHVCALGSSWERRHLLFRDWLRIAPADAALYAAAKHQLSRRDWPDMNAYAEAKTTVIDEIMSRAEGWAATGQWKSPSDADSPA